jgi:DNA-binding CsgD family transcriptional regulator
MHRQPTRGRCAVGRHGGRTAAAGDVARLTTGTVRIVRGAQLPGCGFPGVSRAPHTANVLTPSSPELRAQWRWIRELDAPDDGAATPLVVQNQRRMLLGEGPVRWSAAVGARMADAARSIDPGWGSTPTGPTDHSEAELEALRRTCAAYAVDTLIAIVTEDAAALTRGTEPRLSMPYFLRRGLSVDHLIRTADVYQAHLTEELSKAAATELEPAERMPAQRMLRNGAWAAYQRFLTATWAIEYERWVHTEPGHRLHLVLKLLADPSPQAAVTAAAGSELAYPLERRHVSAVFRVADGRAGVNLPALAHRLATDSGCTGPPLVLPRGHARTDVWFPDPQRDPATRAVESDWPARVMIGVGDAGVSVEGFRSSHRQAEAAIRVGGLRGDADQVTRYAEVELLAVLTADPQLAVTLARRRLGPLASTDVRGARLRETLTAYHAQGMSIGETAAALDAHRNTVGYRLRQIEELLPMDHQGAELRAALLLAAEIPHLVLTAGVPSRLVDTQLGLGDVSNTTE